MFPPLNTSGCLSICVWLMGLCNVRRGQRRKIFASFITERNPESIWLFFRVPLASGPDDSERSVLLCDFASASHTWSEASKYLVWMPQPSASNRSRL